MIVHRSRLGLGARLYDLAKAVAYGKAHQIPVTVDWTEGMYAPRGIDAFARLFASPDIAPYDGSEHVDVPRSAWAANMEIYPSMLVKHYTAEYALRATESIGLHLRQTDIRPDLEPYIEYAAKADSVFVSGDDPVSVNRALQACPGAWTTGRQYAGGKPIHKTADEQGLTGLQAAADLWLLASCIKVTGWPGSLFYRMALMLKENHIH